MTDPSILASGLSRAQREASVAEIIVDLRRAQVVFQARAIAAYMGAPPSAVRDILIKGGEA